jgi:hypothetical protein
MSESLSQTKEQVQSMEKLSAQNYTNGIGSICETLRELKAQRNDLVRVRVALTNRGRAVCRRFVDVRGKNDKKGLKRADDLYKEICAIHKDLGGRATCDTQSTPAAKAYLWCQPMFQARDTIERSEKQLRNEMTKLAAKLPVCKWVDTVKGFGHTNLACIIGETGDLSLYANPAKVWKRLGLAVFNGKRQCKTLNKELAIKMGYSPTRRSAVWTLGDCIIKAQGKGENAGKYRKIYDGRKACEFEKNKKMTPAHAHNRAKRYMEKRLIRDLWKVWKALNNNGGNNAKA